MDIVAWIFDATINFSKKLLVIAPMKNGGGNSIQTESLISLINPEPFICADMIDIDSNPTVFSSSDDKITPQVEA